MEKVTENNGDWREKQTEKVVECLNSAFDADPRSMATLLALAIPCDDVLLDHPYIPLRQCKAADITFNSVTALGLINGILNCLELPVVAMKVDPETFNIVGFSKIPTNKEKNDGH